MQFCSWIAEFVARVCLRLGGFNGCHVRLDDGLPLLPQDRNYSDAVVDSISASMSPDECLLIASDGNSRSEFFNSLRR
jgi:hypothetical protein